MAQRIRRLVAVCSLVAALIAAGLTLVRGVSPVPGLVFLTIFLVATAAKPDPSTEDEAGQGF